MSGAGNNQESTLPNGAIVVPGASAMPQQLQQQQGDPEDELPRQTGPPLADLLTQIEEYNPTIPDSVTQYFLSTAGVQTDDPRIVKLVRQTLLPSVFGYNLFYFFYWMILFLFPQVSLAAQKFISDLANDALQHCKMRGAGQQISKKSKDRKYVLSLEDLSLALADQGVTLKKPPYYL